MSRRRLVWILAGLAVLLGIGHMSFALQARWAPDTLWFTLAGVAFIVTGLINIVGLRAPAGDRLARGIVLAADLALTGFFIVAWPLLKAPQVAVGGLLFAGLAACALRGAKAGGVA